MLNCEQFDTKYAYIQHYKTTTTSVNKWCESTGYSWCERVLVRIIWLPNFHTANSFHWYMCSHWNWIWQYFTLMNIMLILNANQADISIQKVKHSRSIFKTLYNYIENNHLLKPHTLLKFYIVLHSSTKCVELNCHKLHRAQIKLYTWHIKQCKLLHSHKINMLFTYLFIISIFIWFLALFLSHFCLYFKLQLY